MRTTLPLLSLPALLLLASCTGVTGGSMNRPNGYQDLTTQPRQQDPLDYRTPVPGAPPPSSTPGGQAPLCFRQCKPGEHCDASGPIERCVSDSASR